MKLVTNNPLLVQESRLIVAEVESISRLDQCNSGCGQSKTYSVELLTSAISLLVITRKLSSYLLLGYNHCFRPLWYIL